MNNILLKCPDIGENILKKLDRQTLLNSQIVCKQWREFFEHQPFFWLKLLENKGQPTNISEAWKRLINRSDGRNLTKMFGNCLRKKFLVKGGYVLSYLWVPNYNFDLEAPPLHTAAYFGHFEIVKLIYELDEDYDRKIINRKSDEGLYNMAIFLAIQNHHTEIAKFLFLKETIDPLLSFTGHTPLALAIVYQNLELVKFLAPRTTNLNFQLRVGRNSLIHLSLFNYEIFEYLVSLPGINPNLINVMGKTPLMSLLDGEHRIISHEKVPLMVRILARMARNQKFYFNDTPLHCAARSNSLAKLKIVAEYFETSVNVRSHCGFLPIDIAKKYGYQESVEFLTELRAKLERRSMEPIWRPFDV